MTTVSINVTTAPAQAIDRQTVVIHDATQAELATLARLRAALQATPGSWPAGEEITLGHSLRWLLQQIATAGG